MRRSVLLVTASALMLSMGCSRESGIEATSPIALSRDSFAGLQELSTYDPESIGPTTHVFGPAFVTRVAPDGSILRGPAVWTFTIERTDLHTFYSPLRMRVTNGEANGARRVASGSIWIDGQQVIGPSEFSRHAAVIEREIELVSGSVLEVRMRGRPDGRLGIEILGVGIVPPDYVYIEPGSFLMGSPVDELGRDSIEEHRSEVQHPVTLTRGFYMSKYAVTESRWSEAMGLPASSSRLPRVNITWHMAIDYCNALSLREGLTPAYIINPTNPWVSWNREANGYRLPTEAEWEYACRAGSTTAFANGPITNTACEDPILDQIAWYCGNNVSPIRLPVGTRPVPNAWGLYDMQGNVFEWIWDSFRNDYERLGPIDPVHEVIPSYSRVIRSTPWRYDAGSYRSATRSARSTAYRNQDLGFRVVRTAPPREFAVWNGSVTNSQVR